MANVENRAAEHGGEIIEDAFVHTWGVGKTPVVIKAITDTTITAITSSNCKNVEYYDGKVLVAGDTILANVNSLQIVGVVQVIFS